MRQRTPGCRAHRQCRQRASRTSRAPQESSAPPHANAGALDANGGRYAEQPSLYAMLEHGPVSSRTVPRCPRARQREGTPQSGDPLRAHVSSPSTASTTTRSPGTSAGRPCTEDRGSPPRRSVSALRRLTEPLDAHGAALSEDAVYIPPPLHRPAPRQTRGIPAPRHWHGQRILACAISPPSARLTPSHPTPAVEGRRSPRPYPLRN